MFRFLPYILKNLRGHKVRTLMTVGGTALLMLLFGFVTSIQEGLHKLLDTRDDRLIVYQAYRFCPSTSQLPMTYEDLIRDVPQVKEVLPVKVVVNNCRASLDTVIFHGVDVKTLPKVRRFQFLQGDWGRFQANSKGALVGRKIAERRGLVVGKPFASAGVRVDVEGIFTSDQPGEENIIYTHLGVLQALSGAHHLDLTVTLYEVHPADGVDTPALAKAIDQRIRDKSPDVPTETKPQRAHYQRALSDLMDLIGFTRWLGFICVGVVAVLVANSVIMAAQDRVKEHAVLQTIGFSGRRIFGLMLSESLIISIAGGLIGIAGSLVWLQLVPVSISTEGVSIDFLATPGLAALGLGLSVVVGVAAGLVPAWQSARAEIVASMR